MSKSESGPNDHADAGTDSEGGESDPFELIEELQAEAANEQVEELLGLLSELFEENLRLNARLRKVEHRQERLRKQAGLSDSLVPESDIPPVFDHRDKRVLEVLAERDPDVVGIRELQSLYRRVTDIRQRETMQERIRQLVTDGPFEESGKQRWRYLG